MSILDDWQPGACFRLLNYGASTQSFRTRLLAMGMTLGVIIRVIRVAPLGNPIQIDLRGVMVALRHEDLLALQWKKL